MVAQIFLSEVTEQRKYFFIFSTSGFELAFIKEKFPFRNRQIAILHPRQNACYLQFKKLANNWLIKDDKAWIQVDWIGWNATPLNININIVIGCINFRIIYIVVAERLAIDYNIDTGRNDILNQRF